MKDKEVLPIMNPLLGMHLVSAEEMMSVHYADSVPNADILNHREKFKVLRARWDMVNKVQDMGVKVGVKDLKLFGL